MEGQGSPENHQGTVQHVREDPGANSDSCLSWQGRQEQEARGQHAQEAGGGYCKAECLCLALRSLQIEKYAKIHRSFRFLCIFMHVFYTTGQFLGHLLYKILDLLPPLSLSPIYVPVCLSGTHFL